MQRFDCLAKETPVLGPHFLEASAGTGKTFAIEHVVARILLQGECLLEQILVVTFTRAAARELKLRIRSNLEKIVTAAPDSVPYLEGISNRHKIQEALACFDRCQIFTIHGFCSRMLAEFGTGSLEIAKKDGLTPSARDAAIYDFLETRVTADLICPEQLEILLRWAGSMEELVHALKTGEETFESQTFVDRLKEYQLRAPVVDPYKLREDWEALKGNYKKVKGDLEGQIDALSSGNFAKLIQEKGSIFQFISPENKKVRSKEPTFLHYPGFFDACKADLHPLIQKAADPEEILRTLMYIWKPIDRKILLEEGLLTPDELLVAMQKAVATEPFRQKVAQKYGAVLIDEFQDTDPVQWDIFEKLFVGSGKTLYLIGDPKQSIYRFRKADLYTYLRAKEKIPAEGHFYLDTNFRSTPGLLTALNHLFDRKWLHLPRDKTTMPYLPVRAGKDLKTEFRDGKGAVHCVLLPKEEIYSYVAREIIALRSEVPHFSQWAILVKDRFESAEMQKVLDRAGIPSTCRGKEPLFETLAFEAIREVLEAMQAPQDLRRAKRVLAGPFGGLTSVEVQALEFSPFPKYLPILEKEGLSLFFQAFFRDYPLCNAQFSADCTQVLEHLFAWEQMAGFTLDGALHFLASFAQQDKDEMVFQRKEQGEDDVQIMTVHMSKGLEFEFVFALGLASRTPAGDEEAEAEKLRQLYVATTRAKKRLYIPIPASQKQASIGTDAPMELFCRYLSEERPWEEELQRIAACTSLTYEKVEEPIAVVPIERQISEPKSAAKLSLPPFQPSYLLSFTALTEGTPHEALDPLPEGDLPRGAATGVVIHRIYERIFSENEAWKSNTQVSRIVKEEMSRSPFADWQQKVEELVQSSLDLPLPWGFSLRDLEAGSVRAEVEFMFDATPHKMKGFIDLLFQHDGKLYFVDWKTNWLKNYTSEMLQEAIDAHKYGLQASIYAEALKRMGEIGSAIYLFVRGPSAICFEPERV